MFADDLLLFRGASTSQIDCVSRLLNKSNNMSGEQVSHEKTRIFFFKNVSRYKREKLVQMSGFGETNSLRKYLGVPLIGKALRRIDY